MLLVTILEIFYVNVAIGVGCEIGQLCNDLFTDINDKIDQIDWNLYPLEKKRVLILIFLMAQKPVYLEVFGSMAATRETFKNVCTIQVTN